MSMMANLTPWGRLSPAWPNIGVRGLLLDDMDVRNIQSTIGQMRERKMMTEPCLPA